MNLPRSLLLKKMKYWQSVKLFRSCRKFARIFLKLGAILGFNFVLKILSTENVLLSLHYASLSSSGDKFWSNFKLGCVTATLSEKIIGSGCNAGLVWISAIIGSRVKQFYLLIPIGMVILNPSVTVENSESDDDSLEAVCGDDDDTFSCCEDAIPGLWNS